MKSLSTWLAPLFFIGAATSSLFAQTYETPITPTNKIDLFDGHSLDGWTFASKGTNAPAASIWSVSNGLIVCQGSPNGYARTFQFYRDYQLHAEWCYPAGAGNSGVFLHVNPPDKVWPYCYEAQLLSDSAGEIRLNGGSYLTGITDPKVKSVPRQQPSSEKPLGEWNSYDITCRGNTITVLVNGVWQNHVTGTSANNGAIALQAEGKLIWFRNIYLEPLSADDSTK